jgi:hypothetical protein
MEEENVGERRHDEDDQNGEGDGVGSAGLDRAQF